MEKMQIRGKLERIWAIWGQGGRDSIAGKATGGSGMSFGKIWAAGALAAGLCGGMAMGQEQIAPPVQQARDASGPVLPLPRDKHNAVIEGACDVSLVVDDAGRPQKIHVVHCTDKRLNGYAEASVGAYRFIPAKQNGHPVSAQTMIEISVHEPAKDAIENPASQSAAEMAAGGSGSSQWAPVPDAGGASQVGGGVSAPVLIYGPETSWPMDAKGKKEYPPGIKPGMFHKGKPLSVDVNVIVGQDGLVKAAQIMEPGHPDFDANALATVKTYRFKPSMKNGKPVAVHVTIEVAFTIY
jgi:TonB family protein